MAEVPAASYPWHARPDSRH